MGQDVRGVDQEVPEASDGRVRHDGMLLRQAAQAVQADQGEGHVGLDDLGGVVAGPHHPLCQLLDQEIRA